MFALSIKTKVSLVAATAFIALSSTAGFVFNSLTQNSQVTSNIQKSYYPSLQVASVNEILMSQAAEQFNVAVTLGDIEMVNQTMRLEGKINQGLDQLAILDQEGSNSVVRNLKAEVSQYFATANRVASGIINGDTANMSEYGRLAAQNSQSLQVILTRFETLYTEQKTTFDAAVSGLIIDNKETQTMVLTINALGLILIIGMGIMIVAGIKKDLAKISSKMHDIATGDGDLTVRLKHEKHDELKDLVDDFNLFVDKLNTNISDIVADINSLKDISHHLQTANNSTQQLSKAQLISVEESAAAISQMSDVAKEIASNAVNTASAVENALRQSNQSSAFVQETINGFRQLVLDIKGASDVVTELDNSTKNAESILDTINSIAEQTNLLALNAAIEAARAGEQGRGFAVVADEVRTLASRTQSSTQEIQAVLEQLQVQANTAKEIIANSVISAELCSDKSNDAEIAINQVNDNVNDVQQRNELVAAATEQQGNAARQIEQNLIHIRDMSQQTSDSVDMVASVAQQVEVIEKNLTNITSQFKYESSKYKSA